jgi:magnesium-protoporphyrin O-methyltransferase
MACCGSFEESVDQQFTQKKVDRELARYRRKGAGPTARLLLDGLSKAGLAQGTLLDVGAGVGALTFELLERGVRSAIIVEASTAYAAAASAEAARRGRAPAVRLVKGNFLDVAAQAPPADVVTLDRVVCCYPLYAELLAQALRHAGGGFAYSYPRDRWYVRTAVCLENLVRRRGSRFRTFVHPEASMRRLIETAGFELVNHAHTLAWAADVFARRPIRS